MPSSLLLGFFVDINSFFASVVQQIDPSVHGRSAGVVPAAAETSCCIAAGDEANKFGVKTGTRVRDAKPRGCVCRAQPAHAKGGDAPALLSAMDGINRRHGKNALHFVAAHAALDNVPMRIAFNRSPDVETER